jgi:hypothetical protein
MVTRSIRTMLHKKPAARKSAEKTTLSPTMRDLLVSFEGHYGQDELRDGVGATHQTPNLPR